MFLRLRDVILGYCHVDTLRRDPAIPVEERAGKVQPHTRDIAPPVESEMAKDRVPGNSGIRDVMWADLVKGYMCETKGNVMEDNNQGLVASTISRINSVS